jgi:hypothetical protein
MDGVTDVPGELSPAQPRDVSSPPPGNAIEHRRSTALTPLERAQQKRNRRLLFVVAIPAVVLGVAALIASVIADQATPTPHPLFVPAGYHAVGDGVFSYAVPNSWSKNDAYSDDAGDLETSGKSGWVGDHLTARATPPPAGEPPPQVFQSFGEARPTSFSVGPATAVHVAGATVAYRYTMTRADGSTATVVNAWQPSSGAELWLLVDASRSITDQVIATLKAS